MTTEAGATGEVEAAMAGVTVAAAAPEAGVVVVAGAAAVPIWKESR